MIYRYRYRCISTIVVHTCYIIITIVIYYNVKLVHYYNNKIPYILKNNDYKKQLVFFKYEVKGFKYKNI